MASTPEYVRGQVIELGHVEGSEDVSWGKTTEDGLTFTPGSVTREELYTGQDFGPVDSQRTRVEGTAVQFRMAQGDPQTLARVLGLPDSAVSGDKLTVKQTDIGSREFHLYAIVETSEGLRRLNIPRAVVGATDTLNFSKGQWATPGSTMTVLQDPDTDEFWSWDEEVEEGGGVEG